MRVTVSDKLAGAMGALALLLVLSASNAPPPPNPEMPASSGRNFTVLGEGLTIKPSVRLTSRDKGPEKPNIQFFPKVRNWLDRGALLEGFGSAGKTDFFGNDLPDAAGSADESKNKEVDLGQSTTHLKFSGPVTLLGPDLVLKAQVVELDVLSNEVTGGKPLQIPELPNKAEGVVQNPGQVAADMARELKMPAARFSQSAVKSVSASGNVTVTTRGVTIVTPKLASADGGRSWTASSGCTLNHVDTKTQEESFVQADNLVYNMEKEHATAQGNVHGRFVKKGRSPVELEALRCEVDIAQHHLVIDEPLTVRYESIVLNCGSLNADLRGQTFKALGQPKVEAGKQGLGMAATALNVDLDKQIITAGGGVQVQDHVRGITLVSEKLWADLINQVLIATGHPEVTKGTSVFKGEKITVHRKDKQSVIEVEGDQEATLLLDDLKKIKR